MISIVMAYHNRKEQFKQTFGSILKYTIGKKIELIVVDDASKESERLEDIVSCFNWVKLIRIEKEQKWWVNPCVPYNIGFKEITGNMVIIQNPECEHIGNIIEFVENNLTNLNYLSFACLSMTKECSTHIWYNHPTKIPTHYHFCTAITKKNLDLLGGFDERYALGMCYDDNEFVERVKRLCLKIEGIENPHVQHQWHTKEDHFANPKYTELNARNKVIFETLTLKENSI